MTVSSSWDCHLEILALKQRGCHYDNFIITGDTRLEASNLILALEKKNQSTEKKSFNSVSLVIMGDTLTVTVLLSWETLKAANIKS